MLKQRRMQKMISLLTIMTLLFAMLPLSRAGADSSSFVGDDTKSVTSAVYGDEPQHFGITMSDATLWNGEGTEDNPYVITTAAHLNQIRDYPGAHFKLGDDINLNVPPYNAGEGWEPIPSFNGTLDGNGFEISRLYINRPADENVGLLGIISNQAVISNVKLENVNVTGFAAVGGLVGWNSGGSINNSSVSGEMTGDYSAGGLVGDNSGSITDSYASANVTGVESVGGLVGYNFSGTTIHNSHASGKVTGNEEIGGLVGRNVGSISNAYASGEVNGGSNVGGLVGFNVQAVSNAYSSGKVTGDTAVGGLVGFNTGAVTNSYWDIQASGQAHSAAGEGKTTEQLQQQATFSDEWNFFEIWTIGENGSYPILRWELNRAGPPPWSGEGKGTENKPFIVASASQLNEARNYLDAHFELSGDINLSLEYGAGEGWEPIGTPDNPFIGSIDGKGYKILGLYINRPSHNDVGLFGVTGNGAEISNVRLENIEVTGHSNVGGLVGKNGGAVGHVYLSGEVTGNDFVGGFAGANAGNISQSYARSKVEGANFVGGLVGANDGNISDTYASGDVTASNGHAGGLVGSNDSGSISSSYAIGKVTGHGDVGGLTSANGSGNVAASYWDKETTNQATSVGSSEEYGKSTVEMKQRATFAGWDFDRIWAIDEGKSYPYLQSDYEGPGLPWTGSGTAEDPFIIKTATHLDQMRDHPKAHFKLGANINLDVLPYNTGEGWEPIGTDSNPFKGQLDGKGFKITGLYIDRPSGDFVGFFGYTGAVSKISNVKLEDVTVAAQLRVGGLVGYNHGSISYSSVNGNLEIYSNLDDPSNSGNSGVLVGYNYGNISYSHASGLITGSDFLGGLAGANSGKIDQSYASSKVEGADFLGGLVGVNNGRISDSYATGDVIASNGYTGGLAGANDGKISNSYAIGKVIGIGYVGGLVSEVNGGQIMNSFWDKETTLQTASAGSNRSYGKSTAEMKQQATFASWDFDNVWEIEENERYPSLRWGTNANLSGLTMSEGTLSPAFAADKVNYRISVRRSANSVDVTATAASGGASLEVNGISAISGVATTVPLHAGRNTIDVVVTAYDGTKTKRYTIDITRPSDDSSSSDQPTSQIINVPLETGDVGSASTVTQTQITRITEPSGGVRDEAILTSDRAREAAQRIAEAGQTTARIKIPDEEDRVAQVDVKILRDAIRELFNKNVSLEIFTENIRLLIPYRSMDTVEEDLYFRVIPLKEQSQRQEVENRARSERVVRESTKAAKVSVVSRPMTVETNMPNQQVILILPLRDVQLPSNGAERTAFLDELKIFIEHSDGEKRLVKGEIVEYKNGLPGIEFEVNKFSTFTILHIEEDPAVNFHEAYVRGYEDGTFKPSDIVTRAEIAAMIARNLGGDDSKKAAAAPFSDVSTSHWAAGAIEYVKQRGLMRGDAAGAFNPNTAITRGEMAAIVARYKQLKLATEAESITAFSDIAGHWAVLEIAANQQAGILKGYEDGTFRPNGKLTRAEAVKAMNRMFDRGPLYEVSIPTFNDVKETHWAFNEVEEAARDHAFTSRSEGGENNVK
ncbi:S-layer homology domain-containing protein [Cohnella sp. LGH]|uniref:GLUG motif-containing protein n=1 Tax=Cohnella sp. LGH TaxID=1619153 RepID=UPI001ADB1964|nr:GLUG motif-containing protein [Cohnella sp. LGH]QTH44276.1 S-layer homology domain-containing protein [Cohnella sp. LGH]